MSQVFRHEPFGETDIPFAEPGWYRGEATPYYNENHAAFRKTVRDFIDTHIRPFANEWDEAKTFPVKELRKKAYDAGVLSPWASVELGGTPPPGGWDEFHDVIWVDEISRCGAGGVSIVLFFITCMSLPHTLRYGSQELIDRVARPVIKGEAGICITLTEPQGGSDLANLKTTAEKTPCGKFYIVNGLKKFITGGQTGDFFSTAVRTGGPGIMGVSMLLIEATRPGVTITKLKATGWWSGNTTMVRFEDVKVPVGNLIGEENMGFRVLVDVMNWERMIACVGPVRGARACIREAVVWARERTTFGKPLIKHQVIRHKIANMARRVEACQALVDNLAFQVQSGAGPLEIGGPTALAKVQCTSCLEFCAREASQIFGGAAFLRQGKGQMLERIAREVRVSVVGGGSEEIMLDLAMRQSNL